MNRRIVTAIGALLLLAGIGAWSVSAGPLSAGPGNEPDGANNAEGPSEPDGATNDEGTSEPDGATGDGGQS